MSGGPVAIASSADNTIAYPSSDAPTQCDELAARVVQWQSEPSSSVAVQSEPSGSRGDDCACVEAKKRRVEYRRRMRDYEDYADTHGHVLCPFCTGMWHLSNAEKCDAVVIDLVSDDAGDCTPPTCTIPLDDPELSSQRIALRSVISEIEVTGRSHPIWRRIILDSKWKDGDGSVLRGEENMYMETMCFTEM